MQPIVTVSRGIRGGAFECLASEAAETLARMAHYPFVRGQRVPQLMFGEAIYLRAGKPARMAINHGIQGRGPKPGSGQPMGDAILELLALAPRLQALGLTVAGVANREKVLNEAKTAASGVACYDLGPATIDFRVTGAA